MPLNLYDKDVILDACAKMFAENGYSVTTQKLAEAAQISKALLFHHFKNKKQLYFSMLERCINNYHEKVKLDEIPNLGFFEVLKIYVPIKLNYCLENPQDYIIMRDAFYNTPDDIRQEVVRRFGKNASSIISSWHSSFADVPLRKGVDRSQALELITMTIDGFEQRFVQEVTLNKDIEYLDVFVTKFLKFINMIRYGVEG